MIIEKINKKFIECNWKLFNINIYKCELNEYKGNTKGVIFPDCKIFINIEKYSLEGEEEKIKYLNSIEVKNIENIIRENGDDNMEINLINIIPFNKNNFSSSIFSNNIYIYIYIYDEEIIFNISMASKNSLHFYDEIIPIKPTKYVSLRQLKEIFQKNCEILSKKFF